MKPKLLFLFILMVLTGCNQLMPAIFYGPNRTVAPAEEVGIVLAMGQSNMGGGGGHPQQTPAVAFQEDFPNLTVINCSVGGTAMDQWPVGGQLEEACYSAALDHFPKLPVVGILWYQGEADAYLGRDNWDTLFTSFIQGERQRYGMVPLVFAQLATHDPIVYPAPTWDKIKQEQANLSLPYSRMVKTDDLPRVDEVHLTADAALEVGHRMAKAFATIPPVKE